MGIRNRVSREMRVSDLFDTLLDIQQRARKQNYALGVDWATAALAQLNEIVEDAEHYQATTSEPEELGKFDG